MSLATSVVNTTIKQITRIICKVDANELKHIPKQGPLILATNHINFLDVPVVYTHLVPRPVTGFAKAETWDNPFLKPLFDLWEAIPIQRGEADLFAIRCSLDALNSGKIVAIAPEGTRSGNGQLQQGHAGIVTIALRSSAPILPLVFFGNEHFKENFRQFRRTDFQIRVGKPFHITLNGEKNSHDLRNRITDEIMYQLAVLLPQKYRGVYHDLRQASYEYLSFFESSECLENGEISK